MSGAATLPEVAFRRKWGGVIGPVAGAGSLADPDRPWVRPVVLGREDGVPLLALPAAQGNWRILEPCLAPLAERGVRVALVSLRGEREHGAVPPWDLDDLAADVLMAADLAGFERFSLMGTSFGGQVALAVARLRPERIERLVLNVTTARLDAHAASARLLRALPPVLRPAGFHAWAALACTPELLRLGRRLPAGLRRIRRVVRRHRSPEETVLARIELMLETDLRSVLPGIDVPTLVVSGETALDRLVPRACQRDLISRIPDARHVVLRGTGHLGILTAPDRLRDEIAAFLVDAGGSG